MYLKKWSYKTVTPYRRKEYNVVIAKPLSSECDFTDFVSVSIVKNVE